MKRTVIAAAAWMLAPSPSVPGPDRIVPTSPDTAAVHALWRAIDDHWNVRDPDAFARLYTEDASFVFVDRGDVLSGRPQILERFRAQFPAMEPALRHRSTPGAIREVSPEVLAMDGTVEILRMTDPERVGGDVLRTFATFALMRFESGELRIDVLRVYEME